MRSRSEASTTGRAHRTTQEETDLLLFLLFALKLLDLGLQFHDLDLVLAFSVSFLDLLDVAELHVLLHDLCECVCKCVCARVLV